MFIASSSLAGCGESLQPTDPAVATPGLRLFGEVEGKKLFVFNTQLRAIDPEDATTDLSAARGHLQLKLRNTGDGSYAVEWKGSIFNPGGESFIGAGIYSIGEVDGRPIVRLLGSLDVICDGSVRVEGSALLPAVQAEAIVEDPNIFEVRFSTSGRPGGAIGGTLGGNAWGGIDDPNLRPAACEASV